MTGLLIILAVILGFVLMALVVIVGQWLEDRRRELELGRLLIEQRVLVAEHKTINRMLEASRPESLPVFRSGGELREPKA